MSPTLEAPIIMSSSLIASVTAVSAQMTQEQHMNHYIQHNAELHKAKTDTYANLTHPINMLKAYTLK